MTLQIIKGKTWPRLITLGQADKVLAPDADNEQGRVKMADEQKLKDETGIKKIAEEDAGTQGAIGSGGRNAPAQEKVPQKQEDKKNG